MSGKLPSSKIEDYLKAVYFETKESKDGIARTAKIARRLSVTPGTATVMLGNMKEDGYVEYEPRHGASLSERGERLALGLVRKHRLIELFLQKILGLDWGEVHEEAEILEHCFSQRLIERIDELLGFPEKDPHGESIPGEGKKEPVQRDKRLCDVKSPATYEVARIMRQDPEFLSQCRRMGILPGKKIKVLAVNNTMNTIEISAGDGHFTLSLESGASVFVR